MDRGGVTWGVLAQGQVFVCSCRHTRGGTPTLASTHAGAGLQAPRSGHTPDPVLSPRPRPVRCHACVRLPASACPGEWPARPPRPALARRPHPRESAPHRRWENVREEESGAPAYSGGRPRCRRVQLYSGRELSWLCTPRGPWGSGRPRPCLQAVPFPPWSEALRPAQCFQICKCYCSKSEEGRKNLKAWSQLGFIF